MNYALRVNKVLHEMSKDKIDALVVTQGTDVRYLSGFTGEAGVAIVILTPEEKYLVTDGRFVSQAQQETEGFKIAALETGKTRSETIYDAAGRILNQLGAKEIRLDIDQITHYNYLKLENACTGRIENTKPYISTMRMVKDDDELALIRKACNITEQSFVSLLDQIHPGQTEKDVRNILENEFRKRGSVFVAFDTIVASGPINGANPHASLTDRVIQKGDMVTIDFGCAYECYGSDMTRTISFGKPSDELMRIYDTVKAAKDAAVDMLKEGVRSKDVTNKIHEIINAAGYTIPHGPGHGFGLDIHEDPFFTLRNEYCYEAGVVHTVEPGIYVPGVGGVRIEDDYLITPDGHECLTPNITCDLIVL